ncbi:Superoxide dismutase [Geobacillus sp. WSUCF1]|nr:Superoxide dismutase [Geobacillus sp. WSUCF1]
MVQPAVCQSSLPFSEKRGADPKREYVLGQPDFFERFIYGSFADPPQGSIAAILFFLAVFSYDDCPRSSMYERPGIWVNADKNDFPMTAYDMANKTGGGFYQMDDQVLFAQYAARVNEWGNQVKETLALRGASTDGASSLLEFIAEHDGEWTEEAVRELQRLADDVYVGALRQYVMEAAAWGRQVEQALSARRMAEDVGLSSLLAYIDGHGDEWTEEAIYELQRLVDDVYTRAVRLADSSAAEREEEATQEQVEGESVSPELESENKENEDGWLDTSGTAERVEDGKEPAFMAELSDSLPDIADGEPGQADNVTDGKRRWVDADDGGEPRQQVAPGRHVLPPLPYRYDALEPHISEEIMRLHHTKHHQSYVDGLNQAERMMAEARRTNNFDLLKHWEREAAFHGSGHYLHTIFWYNMHPEGGGEPRGELRAQIERDFGSFAAFRRHFTEAAKSAEGVGWALLVWAPRAHRLEILQAEKHQLMAQWDVIPLLVLDVWEHAYYLQYKNDRAAYIEHWWNVVNWRNVEERFHEARKLRWQPF